MSVLERGLDLLDRLADLGDASVADLARRVGTDPSQAHRALRVLQQRGYVEQDSGTKRYRLSGRIMEMASSQLKRIDVRAEAQPILRGLADMTTHTAHLAILSRQYAVIIDRARGASAVSVNIEMGEIAPLHATALGKALLAHLDAPMIDTVLAGIDRTPLTAHTVLSEGELRARLTEIRACGYATDDEEAFEGVRCVAAPVFNWTDRVVAAIGVSGPAWLISPTLFSALAQQVLVASSALSCKLGGRVHE